jgi:hypothetical protein
VSNELYIGNDPLPQARRRIVLSDEDDARATRYLGGNAFGAPIALVDLLTGERLIVRRQDCGLGCRCALELVRTERHK